MIDCISGYISLGSEKIHYLQAGSGTQLLVAFHGYGNDASIFLPLADALKATYTTISIDLPHHGKSSWSDDTYLSIEKTKLLIEELKNKFGVNQLSLLGYSMGGRVCLKIAELMPESIIQIALIASDGLVFNSFYYFLTRTSSGKSLFTGFLKNPKPYSHFIEWSKKLGAINATRYKFAMQYLRAEQDRAFLLRVWPCMSYLIPDIKELKKVITTHKIRVNIFMGKYDTVIPVSLAERFRKEIPEAELIILDKGHKVLDNDTIPIIAKYLLVTA